MNKVDKEFFLDVYKKAPVEPPEPLISKYIERKRILPQNTPFPGYWRNNRTPYCVEIMDNMSPSSPIRRTCVMKSAQTGLTAGAAENTIAYWMDEFPAEILYISATDALLLKWVTKRIEPLIDSCGFRHKIFAQTENKKSRRTGDTTFMKEYVGGNLNMASAQSAPSMRSDSVRILIRDEVDGAPRYLTTGEGDWIEVSEARTIAFGDRGKVLDISTPTTWEESRIFPIYELGDQRAYLVPCPFCKKKQVLQMGSDKTKYGLKPDRKAGKFLGAYYACEHCGEAVMNHHKGLMLSGGHWEPTAEPSDQSIRTYHLNALYSPPGMLSFTKMWQKYEEALNDPGGMRAFTNLYLGLPYKESGSKPKLDSVIELRGAYRSGVVPDGVKAGEDNVYVGPLYLTAGIDVQSGSKTDSGNPPRLEMEVMAMGSGYRTWSIEYRVFEGQVDDAFSGAWADLHEWAKSTGMTYKTKGGRAFPVSIVFIDSGDGNLTNVVYRFVKRWANTYPSKGFSALKKRKGERVDNDEAGPNSFKRYRPVKMDGDTQLMEISTVYYKNMVYTNLSVPRRDFEPQKAGFCSFPVDYSERYFRQLSQTEEKRSDGSFYCPSGARNEALDCRVMNLCAADFYLDAKVMEFKAAAKNNGASVLDIAKINHRFVIDRMNRMMT